MFAESNPGSIENSRFRLRHNKPEPTSKTSARATSPMTSASRIRECPDAVAREFWIRWRTSDRAVRPAVRNPIASPINVVMLSAKTKALRSIAIALARGKPGGLKPISACTAKKATRMPAAPPTNARRSDSVRSCRMIRARPAPSAARIASSPSRWTLRASSRLVTFTHAINRTSTAAPKIERSAGRTASVMSSWSDLTTSLISSP